MAEPINFLPGEVNFISRSPNGVTFGLSFPFDTSGGTHKMLFATSPTGVAVLVLTDGSGLTVTPGVPTTVQVAIPQSLAQQYPGGKLYYDYNIALSGQDYKSKLTGYLELPAGITEP